MVLSGHAASACPDSATIRFRANELQRDPIVSTRTLALKEERQVINRVNDDIDGAIIVKVTESGTAAHQLLREGRACPVGDIFELAIAQIVVQDHRHPE